MLICYRGQTRPASTTTEAESYMRLALAADVFLSKSTPFARATTEDHALDSYQNLLFSIARFHEYTGRYPTKITVVGYEFKQARFTDLHRKALRWPLQNFQYIGVDPDGHHRPTLGEGEVSFFLYGSIPHLCAHAPLAKKWIRSLLSRPVWMPLQPPIKKTEKKQSRSFPFLLPIFP